MPPAHIRGLSAPRRIAAAAAIAFGTAHAAHAQDSHYWTNQFGDRATLLGGAVVGSAVDLSAVYYNPGALSLIEDPDLIAATKVFEWTHLSVEGDGIIGVETGDDRLGLAPGFFAGILPLRFLGDDKLSYSVFTRYSFDQTVRTVGTGLADLLPVPDGDEEYYGSVEFDGRLSETWVGVTWSRPFRNVGFGVSQFVAVRSQMSAREWFLEAYQAPSAAAIAINRTVYRYFHYRLLWKIGVAGEWQGWSTGLTVTTPSVSLFGSGETEVNRTLFGQDQDGDGLADPVFIADFQDGLGSAYRSPFSVAAGVARRFGATRVHVAGEWFAKVGSSVVLEPDPFVGQSTGDSVSPTVSQVLDPVLNVAVGVEHRFDPTTTLFGSFRTDRSGRAATGISQLGSTPWNIYFLTAGTRFRAAGADFTLGLGYGFGSEGVPTNRPGGELGSALPEELIVRYRNYQLIFAFAF